MTTKAGSNSSRGRVSNTNISNLYIPINIKYIANMKNLILAYESIKSKPGNSTPGTDKETLDGLNIKYLENLISNLKSNKFEFKEGRQVMIPKPGKKEKRPLVIGSPRDKIVQRAFLQIMEPHFEAIFLDSSFGFRPKLGLRLAIKDLEAKFQSSR